jgi:hypothetical protein
MTPNMKIIESGLDRLVEAVPEISPHAANAMSAIKASWERAGLQEKRLATAARHNIASYLMGVAAVAYDSGKMKGDAVNHLRILIEHAMAIDAKPAERHHSISHKPPEPWQGKDGGPWKRDDGHGRELTLIHTPNMPGGQWTISIRGVPCLYGINPNDVEARTVALLALLDDTSRLPHLRKRDINWN